MPEVEEQLREYWTSVTVAQPPPTVDDVTGSAPITERHADADHGISRSTSRRQLLAAAVVVLVASAVTVYALVSSAGDDDTSVTTDAPPEPEGREAEEVDDPEPTTLEQVDEGTDEQAGEEAAKVRGTAAETWLPGSAGREVAIIPWREGFLAILPLDGPYLSGSDPSEAETWESPDGVEWSASSNIVFPSGGTIRSDGEHVVVIGEISDEDKPDGVGASYVISASDDLVAWQRWDLASDGVPRDTEVYVDIHELQVLPGGWAAASTLSGDFGETTQRIVTAQWDGELVVHEVQGLGPIPLVAHPDGALASDGGSGLRYSTDWKTWSDLPAPPWGTENLRGLARLPDGVVAVTDRIWVGDSDGSAWRIVEHPRLDGRTIATVGLGDSFSGAADGFAVVADLADYGDRFSPMLDPRIPWDDTYPPPEIVVIASPDGERWLVEDLDVGDEEFEFWTLETIISGDRVLVHEKGEEVMVFEVE